MPMKVPMPGFPISLTVRHIRNYKDYSEGYLVFRELIGQAGQRREVCNFAAVSKLHQQHTYENISVYRQAELLSYTDERCRSCSHKHNPKPEA